MPFIYGIRHNYTIINLKNVSFYLKRIFKLLEYILIKKKKILLIGNSDNIQFLVNKKFIKNNKNIIFFNEEWVNGLITNQITDTNGISTDYTSLQGSDNKYLFYYKDRLEAGQVGPKVNLGARPSKGMTWPRPKIYRYGR